MRCVVAYARYHDETGIAEQLAAGERASANLDYSRIPDEERNPGVSPFLIGYVRLSEE